MRTLSLSRSQNIQRACSFYLSRACVPYASSQDCEPRMKSKRKAARASQRAVPASQPVQPASEPTMPVAASQSQPEPFTAYALTVLRASIRQARKTLETLPRFDDREAFAIHLLADFAHLHLIDKQASLNLIRLQNDFSVRVSSDEIIHSIK
jgi:hypothetical protein